MALKDYQETVTLGRLYKIQMLEGGRGLGESLSPRITVKGDGGSIDLYLADGSSDPASLAEMILQETGIKGVGFASITCYLAVTQNTGTIDEVILTGVKLVEDLGAIS